MNLLRKSWLGTRGAGRALRGWPPAVLLIAVSFAGCAGGGDATMDDAFADPGKYVPYSCGDVDTAISSTTIRITELEQLISRASQGTGGSVMAAVAYRSEYNQARAQLRALKVASADKQCV